MAVSADSTACEGATYHAARAFRYTRTRNDGDGVRRKRLEADDSYLKQERRWDVEGGGEREPGLVRGPFRGDRVPLP